MPTPARWKALQWFADHEADINSVLCRAMPSKRMRTLMLAEGQLTKRAVSSHHNNYTLSSIGRLTLSLKWRRK